MLPPLLFAPPQPVRPKPATVRSVTAKTKNRRVVRHRLTSEPQISRLANTGILGAPRQGDGFSPFKKASGPVGRRLRRSAGDEELQAEPVPIVSLAVLVPFTTGDVIE